MDFSLMKSSLPSSGKCKDCVTFMNGCHYTWDVNYVLFGLLNSLCLEGEGATQFRYSLYQWVIKPLGNLTDSQPINGLGVVNGTPDSLFEGNRSKWSWMWFGYDMMYHPVPHSGLSKTCAPSTDLGAVGLADWPWP
jgi:hypothetical protein